MPSTNWSKLSRLQLGRYAEYYAKMEFTSYGFEVYTSEVDDHGIDFIAKAPGSNEFYEVQVKAIRNYCYMYILKDRMPADENGKLPSNRIVCYLRFEDGCLPEVYTIPARAWETPNDVFKDKDYEGLKSSPEWGLNLSKKNLHLLGEYKIEEFMKEFQ